MTMFLVAFGAMLLIVAGMAVGVLLGRKPIAGSCGGMSAIGMETSCDVCGGDKSKCDTEVKKASGRADESLFYDVSNNTKQQDRG